MLLHSAHIPEMFTFTLQEEKKANYINLLSLQETTELKKPEGTEK